MSTGLFFGKFAPLHNGHVYAIQKASELVDDLHVVLCWDQKFQDRLSTRLQRIMTRSTRMRWLMSTFSAFPNIHVHFIDESPIAPYPNGYNDFCNAIKETTAIESFDFGFSSEPEYEDFYTKCFPGTKHVCIDAERNAVPISATMIRSMSTNALWDFIPPAVREDFALRVSFIGIESTGKSTSTKRLAELLQTRYVEEVGRTLCEAEMFSSEFCMSEFDYIRIAVAHRHKENLFSRTANKVLVSDTNNFITLYSANEVRIPSPVLLDLAVKEHYDAYFVLDTDLPWVYDPLRRKGSTEDRINDKKRHDKALYEINSLRESPIPVYQVSGVGESRLQVPFSTVTELLNTNINLLK